MALGPEIQHVNMTERECLLVAGLMEFLFAEAESSEMSSHKEFVYSKTEYF